MGELSLFLHTCFLFTNLEKKDKISWRDCWNRWSRNFIPNYSKIVPRRPRPEPVDLNTSTRTRGATQLDKVRKSTDCTIQICPKTLRPIGDYSAKYCTWVGLEVKSKISILIPDWRKVEKVNKDRIWMAIKQHWNLTDETLKIETPKVANTTWRNLKSYLISEYKNKNKNPSTPGARPSTPGARPSTPEARPSGAILSTSVASSSALTPIDELESRNVRDIANPEQISSERKMIGIIGNDLSNKHAIRHMSQINRSLFSVVYLDADP